MSLMATWTRGALGNALQSLTELSGAVTDRRRLQESGNLHAISRDECVRLLATGTIGRLAYIARAGVPDIVPVNYVWHDDSVFLRSGPGPKAQAAVRRENVAFEVDAIDEQDHTAWSVVVSGRLHEVHPTELFGELGPEPWAEGPRRHLLRLDAKRIDGRRLG
jgi:hypothetical protein